MHTTTLARRVIGVVLVAHACSAAPGAAQEAGPSFFVTRLGTDTVAVERFIIQPRTVVAEVATRVPRTAIRRYTLERDADGGLHSITVESVNPDDGTTTPVQRVVLNGESLEITSQRGDQASTRTVAGHDGVLPFLEMTHWPFDLATRRLVTEDEDSIVVDMLVGSRVMPFVIRRTGPGSADIRHPFRGTMHTRIGPDGRLLELDASATTRKLTVQRLDDLQLEQLARRWITEDAAGRSFGALSGRGEATGMVDGATISVDYGTPSKRGRVIFGELVPFGEVWRTGANRATHLTTDRDLAMGDVLLPAGQYTLFTIPGPESWTLIINGRTGITGTAYDASADVARLDMAIRSLEQTVERFTIRVDDAGDGGVLRFQWDTTEAYMPFQVR